MDMSKPMEEKADSSDRHKGHDMNTMPKEDQSKAHEGQAPKKVLQKKKPSEQLNHDVDTMPGMDHKAHTPKAAKDKNKPVNHKEHDMKDMPGMDHEKH
jgi:hypothetical protein